ncbi:hypothetical protein DFA_06531 [Cavenderia fasciculata]|uniref:magnesium chelatase n=1 Tax=Cavenderia fasciculata TaxID=261658 RepID=F4PJ95_CACFS|nr:uncharacterized protein DFA_06531 [Cavenderia fasciculata]EGG24381.1 hypothetical protein DFA_06531 [Cavenderia fasciculata]|eukprot:XP_004362232.1 hypothetical protein DFA_06531 [Cavenderia fasciculata]
MNNSRNKVKSVIKKNFYKFTGILGFKSRNTKDQNQDEPNVDVLSLPRTNIDNEIISLERDEFDKRLNDFKSYLFNHYSSNNSNSNNNSNNNNNNITLPNDLIHSIFISILSNTNMLIDTSLINNSNSKQQQQQSNCELLSNIIPLMCGLTCSYITCTRTTTPEDLVQKLFDVNINVTSGGANTSSSSLDATASSSNNTSSNNSPINRLNNESMQLPSSSSTTTTTTTNKRMVDILLVDDLDLAPLPTRYTLFQMMSYRKVAYKGRTLDTPEYFSVIATVSSFSNEFNQDSTQSADHHQQQQQQVIYQRQSRSMSMINMSTKDRNHHHHHIEPISPLILDNFFLNYRLYEPLNVPMLTKPLHDPLLSPQPQQQILTARRIHRLRRQLQSDCIYITNDMEQYIRTIIVNLRNHPLVTYGPSPRATPTLTLASKACSLLSGQSFVTPTHVISVATLVLNHRIFLSNPFPLDDKQQYRHQQHSNNHPLYEQIKSMSTVSTGQLLLPKQHLTRHSLNTTMDYIVDKSMDNISPPSTSPREKTSTSIPLDLPSGVIKSISNNILSQATHLPPPPISIIDTDHLVPRDNNQQQVRMMSPITIQTDDDNASSFHGSELGITIDNTMVVDSFSVIRIMLDNLSPPI